MPNFDAHHAALMGAVFGEFGQLATRTGSASTFPVCLIRQTAESEGVTYPVDTVLIYRTDAEMVIGERLMIGAKSWEIDAILERDELTQTYTLRAES